MENSNTTAKIIGALVAGAAIGAAIGMLLAPEKGSDTRKKIMDGAGDWTDKLKDILGKVINENTPASEEKQA